jgi:hypothetical protein
MRDENAELRALYKMQCDVVQPSDKETHQMKKIALAALACSTIPTTGFGVMILGSVGYQSMTAEQKAGDSTEKPLTGLGLGALVQFDLVSAKVVSLIAGAGLRNSNVSDEQDGIKMTVNNFAATGELGVDAAVIPMLLNLQLTGSYDYGITGSIDYEPKFPGVDFKVDKASSANINARGLVTVFPFVKLGLEASYRMASMTVKTEIAGVSDTETTKLNGTSISGLVGFSF